MLCLKTQIGHGSSRFCYVHPENPNKCVKVAQHEKDLKDLRREIMINTLLRPLFGERMALCESELAQTDKGPGFVCDLVRNHDGAISPPMSQEAFHGRGKERKGLVSSLNSLMEKIIENDIFFFDFNGGNFVIQTLENGDANIIFVDMKSLNVNGYWGFLKLERFVAPLARIIMYRRMRRMYSDRELPFPFDELCRKKLFSSFWVAFRPSLKKWEKEYSERLASQDENP